MHRLKSIENKLIDYAELNSEHLDPKTMGEVIDMIKDISEAIYYCSISKAMEENGQEENRYFSNGRNGYNSRYMPYPPYETRPLMNMGKAYYTEGGNRNGDASYRGRGMGDGRRNYEEGHNMQTPAKELEHYLHELSEDVSDMLQGATHEEKQQIRQKIAMLADKIK